MKSAGKIIIFSRIHSNCFFFLLPSFYKTFSVCGQWLFESIDYYVTTIHHAYPFFLSSISRRDLFEKRSDLSCSLISIQCVPWIAPNLGTLGSDFSPFFCTTHEECRMIILPVRRRYCDERKAASKPNCREWQSSRQSRVRGDWPERGHRVVVRRCTGFLRVLRYLRVLPTDRRRSARCPSATQRHTAN